MNNSIVLGADIGGSHITVALVDLQSRMVIENSRVRVHVNSHGTAEEIITAWSQAMLRAVENMPWSNNIGIAMPNPVDYETGISHIKGIDKYDALYGLNIKELLASRLNLEPIQIRMKNDAGCFLQGETFGGAAKGFDSAIGLTIGTGIGTARCHNNTAEDADLWHSPFKESMVEDYISSRWFVKRYAELSGKTVENVKELASRHATDKHAQAVFTEFSGNLAAFLTSFVKSDNPEVIVVGGNIAHASALFFSNIEVLLHKQGIDVPIRKALLGEDAAIIGAASCWYDAKRSSLNTMIL